MTGYVKRILNAALTVTKGERALLRLVLKYGIGAEEVQENPCAGLSKN